MWRNSVLTVLAVLIGLTAAGSARADSIPVANYSFEDPVTTDHTSPIPGWSSDNPGSDGVLLNGSHGNFMANCDGSQCAYVPLYTNGWIWQDLPNTFTFVAGDTYTLTVALGARSDEVVPGLSNVNIEARLFYRPFVGSGDAPVVATTSVNWTSLSNSAFTDFSATATVNPGDACVGKTMGILIQALPTDYSSDISVDNVRLTVVPEPSSIALTLFAVVGLLAYAWRKRR